MKRKLLFFSYLRAVKPDPQLISPPRQGSTDVLPTSLRDISESMNRFGSSNAFEIFLAEETGCGLSQEEDRPLYLWVDLCLGGGLFLLKDGITQLLYLSP